MFLVPLLLGVFFLSFMVKQKQNLSVCTLRGLHQKLVMGKSGGEKFVFPLEFNS